MSTDYEVLAVRYGYRLGSRADSYYRYSIYGEPDAPMMMDYFFWVIRDSDGVTLVDSGFSNSAGLKRARTMVIEPTDALRELGIEPESVKEIIVSHFHYDHIGNLSAFPQAKLTMQRLEYDFWTGPIAKLPVFAFASEVFEIDHLIQANKDGRIRFVDGDEDIAPGISLQLVGGHCPGQQIIHVDAEQNRLVLASDALHFVEEMERDMPFTAFTDLPDTFEAYATLRDLEAKGRVIVAGHDPLVMQRFPNVSATNPELAVRVG